MSMNLTVNTTAGDANAFDPASVQVTGAMSPTMKTYYNTELLENARPRLIFSQLGKSQFLPAGHGESVQWRKWNTFDKALTPLTEGVIPTGQKFGQSAIAVSVQQYGDYAAISDRLNLHAVDNVILGAAEEMGAAGGETADTLVRNELCTGTSVLYADTVDANGVAVATPEARYELSADNNRLTPDVVNKAYTFLKKQKAPYFEGGKYVAVIHPSVSYDLRSHPDWLEVHKYAATREIFEGEIGELHGVRFVESTEAPIFNGGSLYTDEQAWLTVSAYASNDSTAAAQFGQTSAWKVPPSRPRLWWAAGSSSATPPRTIWPAPARSSAQRQPAAWSGWLRSPPSSSPARPAARTPCCPARAATPKTAPARSTAHSSSARTPSASWTPRAWGWR